MHLVCSTLGFEGYPLEKTLEQLSVIGCDAVEMVLDEPDNPLELLDWKSLFQLQEQLAGFRMRVALLDGRSQRLSQDGDEWLRRAKATVDAAFGVGAPVAEIHLAGLSPRDLAAKLQKLMVHAGRRGVRLAVELPPKAPEPMRQWLQQTDPGLVGMSVDLAEVEGDWRVPVEGWGKRLWSLRVPLSAADSELPARVAALKASGYDGVVALRSDRTDLPPHQQAREALRQLRPLFEALKGGD
ncbi:MAG TPA: hypothetical protein V6D05_03355 [Stenomitos sp.]